MRQRGPWLKLKRAMDLSVAVPAALVLSPVIAGTSVAIFVSLGRPILFRQTRIGRGEREFRIYKFRTMKPGAPDASPDEDHLRITPLGAWLQRAESLIVERWRGSDLDAHAKAMGLQGLVTVRYVVQGSGRVSEARVTRSSGNASLDQMALDAIPPRLPRLPREQRGEPLPHQITLRYRNPLVSTGSEP